MEQTSIYIVNLDEENNPVTLDTPVFRIFEVEHFLSDIKNRRLTLINIQKWFDTSEAALFRSVWRNSQEEVIQKENILQKLFGSSWTIDGNCAGHWHGFSSSKSIERIRVKTTLGNLLSAIDFRALESSETILRAGKVGYFTDEEFLGLYREVIPILELRSLPALMKKSLLRKRDAYAYEREVRLVLYTNSLLKDGLFFCDLTKVPNKVYEAIEISPYLCECRRKDVRQRLVKFFCEDQIYDARHDSILVDEIKVIGV